MGCLWITALEFKQEMDETGGFVFLRSPMLLSICLTQFIIIVSKIKVVTKVLALFFTSHTHFFFQTQQWFVEWVSSIHSRFRVLTNDCTTAAWPHGTQYDLSIKSR